MYRAVYLAADETELVAAMQRVFALVCSTGKKAVRPVAAASLVVVAPTLHPPL